MALGKKPEIITARMELITEGGDKTNVFFDLESANNPRAKKASRRLQTRSILTTDMKDKENPTDEENMEFISTLFADQEYVMAECVVGWEWNGVSLFDGEPPFDKECTPKNVLELLQTPIDGIDILAQVTEKVADLGKPKPAPKKS